MWISRYRWESLVQRVERCGKAIRDQKAEINEKNYDDEIKDIKRSKKYIDDFHSS